MKRILLLLLILLPMAYFSYKNLRVEQDVVLSIEKSEPEAAALFHSLQGSGLFQNKIFVQAGDKREEITAALLKAGYEISSDLVDDFVVVSRRRLTRVQKLSVEFFSGSARARLPEFLI